MAKTPVKALVLSGGGMRGAYEAGVIAGLIEILEPASGDPSPFQIFVGTSVGSLNASFLAANSHRGDLGIDQLLDIWHGLKLRDHLHLDLFGWRRPLTRLRGSSGASSSASGHSLLDPAPLEALVRTGVPWAQLHENIDTGLIRALVTPALEVASGQTYIFAELAPGLEFHPSHDPHRRGVVTRITAEHVLASAAIPVIFPPRRVGDRYFYDGGLRHNTPIAPAIRLGAERLMVVAAMRSAPTVVQIRVEQPGLGFLAGKLLNAVMLDPVAHDMMVLQRLNHLMAVLEDVVSPEDLERVQRVLIETRGVPYRQLQVLSFQPGADLGRMSLDYLHQELSRQDAGVLKLWGLRMVTRGRTETSEADWLSYLLFDGGLARRLIEVGRQDALARADGVRAFFDQPR